MPYQQYFGEIIAHAQCSVDEKKNIYIPCVPHKNNCKNKLAHTT
jgi:formylmethanofuran dehydrogenase subunit D